VVNIRGYLQTSLIEWPGKISSVIFVPGCNFTCPFCHNRDLVESDRVAKLQSFKEEEILKDLKERRKWVDGVVVTGGEPTLQPNLGKFLKRLKGLGFETMIETNGSRPEIIKRLLEEGLLDFVAMDYKTVFADYAKTVKAKSRKARVKNTSQKLKIGGSRNLVERIKRTMRLILQSGLPYEFRTTVVPTIHDGEVLVKMAKELQEFTSHVSRLTPHLSWFLQTFRPGKCLDPSFEKLFPFSQKEMRVFLKTARAFFPKAALRGEARIDY
jgi:pyruvate formate lyase activating enzyme